MLVVEQSKALALKLNHPERVLSTIPTAKKLNFKGVDLVIAPHRLEEVRVLNNLGIRAPSPILHYYDWPGKFKPFDHQRQTAAFLTMHRRCIVLNDIGTGKTQSALWAADYLIKVGAVKKVLVLSPLSTLERVWGDGIFGSLVRRKFTVLHGTAERRKKLLAQDHDFYIVNHDGFEIIAEHCMDMFDLVIVDEAAVLRNPQTRRFKFFHRWLQAHPNVRLWLMTGTPTPNDPTDAWALAKLIGSPFLTSTFTAFREQVMKKVGQWKFIPREDAMETVRHVLQPAVRYTRDECLDLPEVIISTRHCELTPAQRKAYDSMMKSFITEAAGGQVTAANEAIKVQKLIQIACGVTYGTEGQPLELDCSPRIHAVDEIILSTDDKVIIFVPLTAVLHMLDREISKRGWQTAVVNGQVSKGKRDEIFKAFQHDRTTKVLLAHPETMAHGLTLTAAATIIWYGPIDSNEVYVQANGRTERIGKRVVSNVIHIEGTEVERRAYARLQGRQKMQGLLLDLIQELTRR